MEVQCNSSKQRNCSRVKSKGKVCTRKYNQKAQLNIKYNFHVLHRPPKFKCSQTGLPYRRQVVSPYIQVLGPLFVILQIRGQKIPWKCINCKDSNMLSIYHIREFQTKAENMRSLGGNHIMHRCIFLDMFEFSNLQDLPCVKLCQCREP